MMKRVLVFLKIKKQGCLGRYYTYFSKVSDLQLNNC